MPYKDPKKRLEYAKNHYHQNREKELKNRQEYYYEHWHEKQEYRNKWLMQNPEKFKAYKKKYAQSPKGKLSLNKGKSKWRILNPEKSKAHSEIRNAVRRKEIIKPKNCEYCNKFSLLQGHHYLGYKKVNQLKVKWLCRSCHMKEHYELS